MLHIEIISSFLGQNWERFPFKKAFKLNKITHLWHSAFFNSDFSFCTRCSILFQRMKVQQKRFSTFQQENHPFSLSMNCNDNSQVCVISLKQKLKIHNSSQLLPLQTGALLQQELRAIWSFLVSTYHWDQFAHNDKITVGGKHWGRKLLWTERKKSGLPCSSCLPPITSVPKLWLSFIQADKKLSSYKVLSMLYSHTPLSIIRGGGFGGATQPQKRSEMAQNITSRLPQASCNFD